MSDDSFDDLPPFARDALASDALPKQLRDTAEALGSMVAIAKPESSQAGRARLLAAVSHGPERYGPFFAKLSQLVDLGIDRVQAIFADADDRQKWQAGPLPGISLYHFTGGPAVAHADTGLVQIAENFVFPEHKHLGREQVLILEGAYRESTGRIYRAGDFHEMAEGTTHGYVVLPGRPLLVATAIENGIEIGGVKISG